MLGAAAYAPVYNRRRIIRLHSCRRSHCDYSLIWLHCRKKGKVVSYACPKCQSENTQKISAIIASGTTHGDSTTVTVGAGGGTGGLGAGVASGKTTSQFQTSLVKKFPEPVRKSEDVILGFIIGSVMFGVLVFFLIAVLFGMMGWNSKALMIVLSLPAFFYTIPKIYKSVVSSANSNKEFNLTKLPAERDLWNHGFYCHRCENVYNPVGH